MNGLRKVSSELKPKEWIHTEKQQMKNGTGILRKEGSAKSGCKEDPGVG